MGKSDLEETLLFQMHAVGLPEPERNVAFVPGRKFTVDFAWPDLRIAIEVEGGIFALKGAKRCPVCGLVEAGAHGRGWGIVRDIEKGNLAVLLGWRLFRVTARMIESGEALALIERALAQPRG